MLLFWLISLWPYCLTTYLDLVSLRGSATDMERDLQSIISNTDLWCKFALQSMTAQNPNRVSTIPQDAEGHLFDSTSLDILVLVQRWALNFFAREQWQSSDIVPAFGCFLVGSPNDTVTKGAGNIQPPSRTIGQDCPIRHITMAYLPTSKPRSPCWCEIGLLYSTNHVGSFFQSSMFNARPSSAPSFMSLIRILSIEKYLLEVSIQMFHALWNNQNPLFLEPLLPSMLQRSRTGKYFLDSRICYYNVLGRLG